MDNQNNNAPSMIPVGEKVLAQPAAPDIPTTGNELNFTEAQIRTLYDDGVKRGSLTRAQADTLLQREGFKPAAPDTRPEWEKSFAPPKSATDYALPFDRGADVDDKKFQDQYQNNQKAVHAGGFSAELGRSLFTAVEESAKERGNLKSEQDIKRWSQRQTELLEGIWGKDKIKENLATVGKFIGEVEVHSPGFLKMLDAKAANAMVIKMLFDQAVRNGHRRS